VLLLLLLLLLLLGGWLSTSNCFSQSAGRPRASSLSIDEFLVPRRVAPRSKLAEFVEDRRSSRESIEHRDSTSVIH